MANKPLKSITFPGLTDTYTIPQVDSTLTVSGDAADAKAVGDQLTDLKADLTGMNATKVDDRALTMGHLTNEGTWNNVNTPNFQHCLIPVNGNEKVVMQFDAEVTVGFVKTYTKPVNDETVDYSSDASFSTKKVLTANTEYSYEIPSDVRYIIVERISFGRTANTIVFTVDEYNLALSVIDNFDNITQNPDLIKYHGGMTQLGYTSFVQCDKDGYYTFSQNHLPNITDKPNGLNYGGIVFMTNHMAAIDQKAWFVSDTRGNEWLKVSQNDWLQISKADNSDIFEYRGDMSVLGYTTFHECNQFGNGYYNFSQSYVPSITDKPDNLTSGGIICYYSHFAGSAVIRKIVDSSGNEWFKINQGGWKQTIDVSNDINIIQYRGNMSDLGYTSFQSCNQRGAGYYNFSQSYLSSITDKPDNLTSGGFIYYYSNFAGGSALRRIVDSSGNEWIKLNQGNWLQTINVNLRSDTVWYAFGDSITRGLYSTDVDTALGPTTRNYVYWVATRNGYKVTNYGESGSGYLKAGENGNNGKNLIDSIDFSNCNLVTFAWGVNDWHYNQNIGTANDDKNLGTTMASNMKYCIEKVLTDNPLCKLIILLPMNCARYGGTFDSDWGLGTSLETSGTLQHVINVIKEIAEYYHLQVIDQSNTSVVNRVNIWNCLLDGIHPSVDCYKQIGLNLAKQIQFA